MTPYIYIYSNHLIREMSYSQKESSLSSTPLALISNLSPAERLTRVCFR